MAKIFITGSSDGLGFLTGKALIAEGHQVIFHARNSKRKEDTLQKLQSPQTVLTGDLSDIDETKALAVEVNELGDFDVVIHNAGINNASGGTIFAVNVLAPYILTSLIEKPKRLIYLTSDMHLNGRPKLEYIKKDIQRINYSDTKLHVLMLCKAVARKWTNVFSNAIDPGWVPTKMGGSYAPGSLQKGYETQLWLATSNDERAKVNGHCFFHQKIGRSNPEADDIGLQERLLKISEELTGVSLSE